MDSGIDDVEIRLADCQKFSWMGGMKTMCGVRLKEGWQLKTWLAKQTEFPPVPDIEDPATKGCLLQIVRNMANDNSAYVAEYDAGWVVHHWPEHPNPTHYKSEGVALAEFIING